MFDAAYWRAREGELARTIMAGEDVASARVHIATPGRSPFARDRDATASVTMQVKNGAVPAELAEAVQSLVAGAVRGLTVESVSVVDSRSGRVVSRDASARDGVERAERLAEMRAAVDRLLSARVGPGRFVAEVNVETTTDVEQLRETIIDPDSRVVVSTDTQESTASEVGGSGQGVTVASNLPDGDAAGGGSDSRSNSTDTRERVNYEVSETQRQVTRGAGAVERVTVAVMVDGVTAEDGTWTPRAEDELDAIRELVGSAVGIREGRGDVVTVRSLPFEALADAGIGDVNAPFLTGAQVVRLASVAALLIAALAVPAMVVRPLLAKRDAAAALPAPDGLAALDDGDELAELPALDDGGLGDLPLLGDDSGDEVEDADPVDRLRRLIEDRRDETVEVLKDWIGEDAAAEEAQ